MPHRMDTLTNEKTLLSVSRSAELSSSATPTGEGPIRDTKDNLDAIQEVGYQANDDALAPPVVGAHGSYSFSMHALNLSPHLCFKMLRKINLRIWLPLKMTVKLEVRTEARSRSCRPTSFKTGSLLRTLTPPLWQRILELGSGLSKARHSDGGRGRRKVPHC